MKFDLHDLQPKHAELKLSDGKTYTLKKFSLAAQIWAQGKFGDQIEGIFANRRIGEISEIAYYLLIEKPSTVEGFQELICTQQDKLNLITALLETIGLSQPVIEKISKENLEGNELRPN